MSSKKVIEFLGFNLKENKSGIYQNKQFKSLVKLTFQ